MPLKPRDHLKKLDALALVYDLIKTDAINARALPEQYPLFQNFERLLNELRNVKDHGELRCNLSPADVHFSYFGRDSDLIRLPV